MEAEKRFPERGAVSARPPSSATGGPRPPLAPIATASPRTGAAVQSGDRPPSYYIQPRPDVAALVPPACRRVLEVGCGAGQLGRHLRERGHHVTGIELVREAADEARRWLDHVETADV